MTTRTTRRVLPIALLIGTHAVWAGLDQSNKPADAHPSEVASAWFDTLYDVVKTERTSPPPASRIYGIAGVALYESIVGGSEANQSLSGQLNDLGPLPRPRPHKKYHWPTVANSALAAITRGLYANASPTATDLINAREHEFASRFQSRVPGPVYDRSVELGRDVASAVLLWSATDGASANHDCTYVPADVEGAWEPTPPMFSTNPLEPCWGENRPMALTSGTDCAAPGPPQFSTDASSEFYAAAQEVHDIGVDLTPEQKAIADYWADGPGATGTPAGHWVAIVAQISRDNDLSLVASAEAFARVGIAMHDAFIACWSTKYTFNLQRPVTFIHDHIDPAWSSYVTTPVFPSYSSGHSTQSGAAAAALTDLLGIVPFTDATHTVHGLVPPQATRSFDSLDEAADEAALSRLYGGIHYRFDNDDGLAAGRCIGSVIDSRLEFRRERDDRHSRPSR